MFRNCLAILGAIFLAGIFKSQIVAKVPALNILPIPSVSFQWGNININNSSQESDRPANNPNNSPSQPSPSPSPSPQGKRWGIHFEMKSNIGDQSDK
jgi:hypothetical protein